MSAVLTDTATLTRAAVFIFELIVVSSGNRAAQTLSSAYASHRRRRIR